MSKKADETAKMLLDTFKPGDRVYHIAAPGYRGTIVRRHDSDFGNEAYQVKWQGSTRVSWCSVHSLRHAPSPKRQ